MANPVPDGKAADQKADVAREKGSLRLPVGAAPSWEPTSAEFSDEALSEPSLEHDRRVWLHIYHCDAYTGFMNTAWLKRAEMPIYHAGVEVYGEEWAFQYYEDALDDVYLSGLVQCRPKMMMDFVHQESLCLGSTPLSEGEVDEIIREMGNEWRACTYHLTRRNCLTFAESLVRQLKTPETYPDILRWVGQVSHSHPNADAVIDYGWMWAKWWMMRKHQRPQPSLWESTCRQCSVCLVDKREEVEEDDMSKVDRASPMLAIH